jgi:protocatechuate 3,4-dioxygenase alpha subunit
MKHPLPTAEMTLGPFFPREFGHGADDLTACEGKHAEGEVIEIAGRVTQGDCAPPAFFGWGRAATDSSGVYRFRTIRPGAYAGRAPHVNFLILFSGLMRQLQTVMFFDGDNGKDPVFNAVSPPALRERLVAKKSGKDSYRFDIRLRGEGETPFFDD